MKHKWDSKKAVAHCIVCGIKRDKRNIPAIYFDKNGLLLIKLPKCNIQEANHESRN